MALEEARLTSEPSGRICHRELAIDDLELLLAGYLPWRESRDHRDSAGEHSDKRVSLRSFRGTGRRDYQFCFHKHAPLTDEFLARGIRIKDSSAGSDSGYKRRSKAARHRALTVSRVAFFNATRVEARWSRKKSGVQSSFHPGSDQSAAISRRMGWPLYQKLTFSVK
jgi:hypothetical protein